MIEKFKIETTSVPNFRFGDHSSKGLEGGMQIVPHPKSFTKTPCQNGVI